MRLVVVGGVAAGLSAAAQARRQDRGLEIVVLEKGDRISYGACGLPYWIEGQVDTIDELVVYKPEFFERERDIRIRTRCEVKAVQHARREVLLASGERLGYDRLIWAAGARPAQPARGEKVFNLHTDVDAARLRTFLTERKPKTAAVVGGGAIGLEMVTALRARGLAVTLYQDGLHLLEGNQEWLTKAILQRLERCRVALRMNVRIDSHEALADDLVVVATGLKPNVEVLSEAGAELGRSGALRVDERMETTLRGVYAAGDCAEAQHIVAGRPMWIPMGTTANKMGRVAGSNAAGGRERFEGIAGTSIVRVAGLAVAVTGLSPQQARREGFTSVEALAEGRDRPRYFRGARVQVQLTADRNTRRLLGGAVAGDEGTVGRINVIAAALAGRMKASDFAALDLAYAPPYATVVDPLLLAASRLAAALD